MKGYVLKSCLVRILIATVLSVFILTVVFVMNLNEVAYNYRISSIKINKVENNETKEKFHYYEIKIEYIYENIHKTFTPIPSGLGGLSDSIVSIKILNDNIDITDKFVGIDSAEIIALSLSKIPEVKTAENIQDFTNKINGNDEITIRDIHNYRFIFKTSEDLDVDKVYINTK